MTLVSELLQLPDRVRRGDFVLRLTEGVTRPDETLGQYVVTPQLVKCFDQALGLIYSAVQGRTSKACYLHGSFGSGKSHFMAVLHLLLQGNTKARSIPELAEVVSDHNEWTEGRKFLLVPYHMIGQPDMETAILGGFVDTLQRVHPDEPPPGVYRADEILADGAGLRESMGDEAFFEKLNADGTSSGDSGWGNLEQGWDGTRFEAALAAPPKSDERQELVKALVQRFFTAARSHAEYVDLDHGLSIVSKHAKKLGYDAVILFLDELILWLASRSADVQFVSREGQKLAKLVEAQTADRPVPLVSFVARQRDLRELVGDKMPGADFTTFSDVLTWWEGRFATITLEDRNLPAIAEKRVLKPKSDGARAQIDAAFSETARIRDEVMDVLLTSQADRELFRRIYPFSPAFMEMLVEMSFLLQRDRTALKVMLQLLIDQRSRLQLKDVVPVGDLFDYIAEGDEAVSDDIRRNFEYAKRLYEEKLRPILERDHGMSVDSLAGADAADARAQALRNDDRLVKTLLLAALAPNLESFRGLTAGRLAALNHGTIRSPIPGREGAVVLQKCRKWATEVGQIKIGDEPVNPTIGIQLTGVDTEGIIRDARRFDNTGNRIRKIKELIFQQFGIEESHELYQHHAFQWRGTRRTCEVIFANVRELPLDSLEARGDDWKVVIDWPFDEGDHGPADDKANMSDFRAAHAEGTRTIVMLPSFLGAQGQRDLGRLVILDYLLTGENFRSHVANLTPADQQTARSLLENQHSQLQQRLITSLETAYGISNTAQEALDARPGFELEPDDHLHSLMPGFQPRPPAAADLQQGFEQVLDQALAFQFPAAPVFDNDLRIGPALLKRVCEELTAAAQESDGRHHVDRALRREMRQVAVPLKLGEMGETHFILGQHWRQHFLRKEHEHGGPLTVGRLRGWLDEPAPMGLPVELASLVVTVYATQSNRPFFLHGAAVDATLADLTDDMELRAVALPSSDEWGKARERAGHFFGLTASPLLNATNLSSFATRVREIAAAQWEACRELLAVIASPEPLGKVSTQDLSTARYRGATAACNLITSVREAHDRDVVTAIASFATDEPDAAVGTSLKKAGDVLAAIRQTKWQILDTAFGLTGAQAATAAKLKERLRSACETHEHAVALAPVLQEVETLAVRLIKEAVSTAKPEPDKGKDTGKPDTETQKQKPDTGRRLLGSGSKQVKAGELDTVFGEIQDLVKECRGALVSVTWEIRGDSEDAQ